MNHLTKEQIKIRNEKIVAMVAGGTTRKKTAALFGISGVRVQQIVNRSKMRLGMESEGEIIHPFMRLPVRLANVLSNAGIQTKEQLRLEFERPDSILKRCTGRGSLRNYGKKSMDALALFMEK
jgi:DNA-binding CsgD family transcriptional regulator